MRLAYTQTYAPGSTSGGSVHVRQFIANAVALGHEVWTPGGDPDGLTRDAPTRGLGRLLALRRADALYMRVAHHVPGYAAWGIRPRRSLIGRAAVVWEFNTVPEFGLVKGQAHPDVAEAIRALRHFGRGCDLAICVSRKLAEYVQCELGIARAVCVPNASDPSLFRPDARPVTEVERRPGSLNAVWMGSAGLAWHDIGLLRDAARILWERGRGEQVRFHMVGARPACLDDMPPNVAYHGPQPYRLVPNWLAAMDVGLCLTRPGPADYSSPLKLYDYLASGLAVVGTPQPQVGEVLRALGQGDSLVPPGDAGALAELLLCLAADPERVRRQGARGRRLIEDRCNWRDTTRTILDEVQRATDGRPAAHLVGGR